MEGTGRWFDSESAARAYVISHFKRGARSFDVGCFQINYKWHGASFRSIEHMFDPLENARYAAAFLRRLYRESGDWSVAAGTYHSRTPEYAARYQQRFDRIRRQHAMGTGDLLTIEDRKPKLAAVSKTPRQNSYPLLQQSGSAQSHGSLVPLSTGRARSLLTMSGMFEGS